jgi:hypothetical protein
MDMEYPEFGTIIIDGTSYNHDVVVDGGLVSKKGPSKRFRSEYGHTPLSAGEEIPWSQPRLAIGTGFSGRLPVMLELKHRAEHNGVELVTMPTADACVLLRTLDSPDVNAILHVTC